MATFRCELTLEDPPDDVIQPHSTPTSPDLPDASQACNRPDHRPSWCVSGRARVAKAPMGRSGTASAPSAAFAGDLGSVTTE
jgi:hypothetical protein